MNFRTFAALLAMFSVVFAVRAKLPPEQIAKLPAPVKSKIDFARDVKPIFDSACVKCHGKGKDKGNFSLETRAAFMKGGDSGTPIVEGKSAESLMIELVSGFDPETVMPKKGSKLKREQVALLRAWIDQGANWPAEITFTKVPVNNLSPRKPELPPVKGGAVNPVDRFLEPYFAARQITPPPPVNDRLFARRVYLDTIGLLPTPAELQSFLDDSSPKKRQRLVASLLADNERYAEHWLTFWNDLLRNDYKGTGYIDDGRKQITGWLFEALLENRPYNEFVAQLMHPGGEAGGFINGIVWRGAVNASQTPPMQAAQSISQVFMGVNLKCASCHDSFINDYTLADSYGLASIYATNTLEMFECDKPTGRKASVKFLYSELGEINGDLPRAERSKQLAGILTSKENGRVTRTVVNRLWAKFMGHGLVEPVDEMDQPAWNQDLLDWLAADLAESGYDLKNTMERILTSNAYALPSVDTSETTTGSFVFNGPQLRRMTAEQFADALSEVNQIWNAAPDSDIEFVPDFSDASAIRPSLKPLPSRAKWIWADIPEENIVGATNVFFRRTVLLPEIPDEAAMVCASGASIELFINGKSVPLKRSDKRKIHLVNIRKYLAKGDNLFAVRVIHNFKKKETASQVVGVWIDCRLRDGSGTGIRQLRRDVVSDAGWNVSADKSAGWEKPDFKESWPWAVEVTGASEWRDSIERQLRTPLALASQFDHVRASLVAANSLTAALGRPNREQITTVRQSAATTLQGLELTNGETLNKFVKRGAEKWLAAHKRSAEELVEQIFVKSLGRKPTGNEVKIAIEVVGSPAKQEGIEDLLWSVAMLPEFQFIY